MRIFDLSTFNTVAFDKINKTSVLHFITYCIVMIIKKIRIVFKGTYYLNMYIVQSTNKNIILIHIIITYYFLRKLIVILEERRNIIPY